MPLSRKSFDVAVDDLIDRQDREPLLVDYTYKDGDGHSQTETFAFRPWLAPDVLFLKAPNVVDTNTSTVWFTLLRACLSEEDYERFDAFISRSDVNVDANRLGELIAYLWEERTGRPTEPPSSS